MRCIWAALIAVGLYSGVAAAQSRVVVVPAGDRVIVPPRGGAMPASAQRRMPRARRVAPPLDEQGGGSLSGGSGLAVPFLALLPLAAAAALSATLPGSGGGTSSPARTR